MTLKNSAAFHRLMFWGNTRLHLAELSTWYGIFLGSDLALSTLIVRVTVT